MGLAESTGLGGRPLEVDRMPEIDGAGEVDEGEVARRADLSKRENIRRKCRWRIWPAAAFPVWGGHAGLQAAGRDSVPACHLLFVGQMRAEGVLL